MLPKNQPFKPFLVFSVLGLQIGIAMYAASLIGEKLDLYSRNEKPWWTLLSMIFALVGVVVITLKRLGKEKK